MVLEFDEEGCANGQFGARTGASSLPFESRAGLFDDGELCGVEGLLVAEKDERASGASGEEADYPKGRGREGNRIGWLGREVDLNDGAMPARRWFYPCDLLRPVRRADPPQLLERKEQSEDEGSSGRCGLSHVPSVEVAAVKGYPPFLGPSTCE